MSSKLIAGSRTTAGYVDAVGENARFNYPGGIETDGFHIYVTEYIGDRVRKVDLDTLQVTTVATLPAGSKPLGIQRHNVSGKWYIACSGSGSIRIYNSDWTFFASRSVGSSSRRPYHVHVNAAETRIWASGDQGAEGLDDTTWRMNADGTGLTDISMGALGVPGGLGAGLTNPGGMYEVGSYLYFLIGRFEEGMYRINTDLTGATGNLNDGTQSASHMMHYKEGDKYYWVSGANTYGNIDSNSKGILTYDISDNSVEYTPPQQHQPYLTGYMMDAVFVRNHYYTVNSRIEMTQGFTNYTNASPSFHSVERIDVRGGWKVGVIAIG